MINKEGLKGFGGRHVHRRCRQRQMDLLHHLLLACCTPLLRLFFIRRIFNDDLSITSPRFGLRFGCWILSSSHSYRLSSSIFPCSLLRTSHTGDPTSRLYGIGSVTSRALPPVLCREADHMINWVRDLIWN